MIYTLEFKKWKMLNDPLYNLMEQLCVESKSLWRMENNYCDDCGDEKELEFWKMMIKDKEEHIADLKELIKARLSSE